MRDEMELVLTSFSQDIFYYTFIAAGFLLSFSSLSSSISSRSVLEARRFLFGCGFFLLCVCLHTLLAQVLGTTYIRSFKGSVILYGPIKNVLDSSQILVHQCLLHRVLGCYSEPTTRRANPQLTILVANVSTKQNVVFRTKVPGWNSPPSGR